MIAHNRQSSNIFIRIGLFLLTVLAVAAALGLSILIIDMEASDRGIGTHLIISGIVVYGGLEFFIHTRRTFQAGVADALLWTAGVLIFGGITLLDKHITATAESGIVLILAAWGVLRYADRLMALVAYGAFVSLIFHLTKTHSAVLPFVIMAISVAAYVLFTRLSTRESMRHYQHCLWLQRMATLLTFYLAGNYYVAQNIHGESTPVPLSGLWWAFTVIIPVVYIVWGIRKKDTILLWTGLALVAAAVFTVRYYYHVLPAEIAMILGGSILIATSYGLIRYLRTPKRGFTSEAPDEPHALENLPVEGLILTETFKSIPTPIDQTGQFGGGSGGGAGAGGTY